MPSPIRKHWNYFAASRCSRHEPQKTEGSVVMGIMNLIAFLIVGAAVLLFVISFIKKA